MPGADFGIVMIVADVAASWGQHSVSGYDAGRPQISALGSGSTLMRSTSATAG